MKKICETCSELGSELPAYEEHGNTIQVHYTALKAALLEVNKQNQENEGLNVSVNFTG